MRVTPKQRFTVAMLLSWPVGFIYLYWLVYVGQDILRHYNGSEPQCDGGWRSVLNGCSSTSYNVWIAWFEVIVVSAVVLTFGLVLGLWVVRPFRDIASIVGQLGPNSLGVRVRATGRKDEVRVLSDAIDAMIDRVADGYEAQRRFAANASHELRTPLATQRALIEVSLSHALNPDQLDLLTKQLLSTNERNERLIDGLLTLAETEQGLRVDVPQRLDQIAAMTVETFRPFAAERGVVLYTDLAAASVVGEQPLLERLCANLVQNAVKYNLPAGSDGTVHVQARGDGSLRVSNTGPVVPADLVPTLFEPFRRASGDRLEHGGGAGLGLTIARSIVAAHGGTIRAHANPEGGLTVEVRLRPA